MNEQEEIVKLHEDGFSLREISQKTGIPKSSVARKISLAKEMEDSRETIEEENYSDDKKSLANPANNVAKNSPGQWLIVAVNILILIFLFYFIFGYPAKKAGQFM
ncbi:MAG: sigma-70 region 4 domain-containing protein [Bacteroidetes bacterium]|nr:sigma-70 region 4 domain-containing protein [Bacteroidota bacterium]